jgi:hypothetical protein
MRVASYFWVFMPQYLRVSEKTLLLGDLANTKKASEVELAG